MKYKDLLISNIRKSKVWSDLADAVEQIVKDNIDAPVKELRSIRNTTRLETKTPQDINYLFGNAKMLGFDFLRDFINIDDYQRIIDYTNLYNPKRGTKQLGNFIGFIKNTRFVINQLWCNKNVDDYEAFYPEPLGTTVLEDYINGLWYPTSHVELTYDPEVFLQQYAPEMEKLFYLLAPINLVLARVEALIELNATIYLGAIESNVHHEVYGYYDFTSFETPLYFNSVVVAHYHNAGADLTAIPHYLGHFNDSYDESYKKLDGSYLLDSDSNILQDAQYVPLTN